MTLWDVLRQDKNYRHIANVEELVKYAEGLLDLVRDTFPTYTLHNRVHAENVMRLMESLLGNRIRDLTSLEAAILILSAYFHDAGMAFMPEEILKIEHSEDFKSYLQQNPQQYLKYRSSSKNELDD